MKFVFCVQSDRKISWLNEATENFLEKISQWRKCEILYFKDDASVKKQITERDFVLLCDERGKEFGSEQLAHKIQSIMNQPWQRILIIVGGAYGFSEEIRQLSKFTLSLSKMTLGHQIAQIQILEQIYRALCILNNHPYHHGN